MSRFAKTMAKEWLTLIGAIIGGFAIVPMFLYVFLSPAEYTSKNSLLDIYKELFNLIKGENGRAGVFTAIVVVFGPYLLYQFGRSIVWAIREVREKKGPV
jgi:hypothetical protein